MVNIIADVSFGLHKRSLEKHETKKKNIYVKLQTPGLFRFFFQTPIGSKLRKKKAEGSRVFETAPGTTSREVSGYWSD